MTAAGEWESRVGSDRIIPCSLLVEGYNFSLLRSECELDCFPNAVKAVITLR